MKEMNYDLVNRYLVERASCMAKTETKEEKKPSKKIQKDEMENEEEEEKEIDPKKVKAAIKGILKVHEVLLKKEEEKLASALEKILTVLGWEKEEAEEE